VVSGAEEEEIANDNEIYFCNDENVLNLHIAEGCTIL
jgi:hypothetical protein